MEEQIKNIVSQYIKVPAEQITSQTVIDRSAVASSIILHRMYAQLANNGIVVKDHSQIKTFGQLTAGINGNENVDAATVTPIFETPTDSTNGPSIGIDTENIAALPVVNDFREDAFYKMNFAPSEIAYCILQTNPYASFAGLFAAKEAIIKADNAYQHKPFHSIIIDHLPQGKPVHAGFQLSISHSNETAIAVAVKNYPSLSFPSLSVDKTANSTLVTFLAFAAFFFFLFAIMLFFFRN